MAETRVTVVGECMLELSPASLASAFPLQTGLSFGGDTLNTALYLSRLNISTSYISALGQDPYSEALLNCWRQEGLDCDLVYLSEQHLPGMYAIHTDEHGERSFYYWREHSAARVLFNDWPRLKTLLADAAQGQYLYLSGITLALCSQDVLQQLLIYLHQYRANGGKLVFDSNYRPRLWPDAGQAAEVFQQVYQLTDIALPTLDDELLLSADASSHTVIEQLQRAGVSEIVLKQGTKGCELVTNQQRQFIPLDKVVTAVDTTAAGDSFNAAYLAARCRGLEPKLAVKAAQRLSAAVVQQPGAIIDVHLMPEVL